MSCGGSETQVRPGREVRAVCEDWEGAVRERLQTAGGERGNRGDAGNRGTWLAAEAMWTSVGVPTPPDFH